MLPQGYFSALYFCEIFPIDFWRDRGYNALTEQSSGLNFLTAGISLPAWNNLFISALRVDLKSIGRENRQLPMHEMTNACTGCRAQGRGFPYSVPGRPMKAVWDLGLGPWQPAGAGIQTAERREGMKVIFEEYSGIIITAFAIIALIAVVALLLATDGPVHTAFVDLIDDLFQKASVK